MCKCQQGRTDSVCACKPKSLFHVGDVCRRMDAFNAVTYTVRFIFGEQLVAEHSAGGLIVFGMDGYCAAGFKIIPPKRTRKLVKYVFNNPKYPKILDACGEDQWKSHASRNGWDKRAFQRVELEVPE